MLQSVVRTNGAKLSQGLRTVSGMRGDLDRRVAEIAASQHGLVSRPQARAIGMTVRMTGTRLGQGRWIELQIGVYALAGSPDSPQRRLLAAVLRAGPEAVASHGSAAASHGIPGFSLERIEVLAPQRSRPRPQPPGLRWSCRMPAHHRTTRDGIPVTTVARTLFDLCATVHPKRAERAVDTCLARGLVSFAELLEVFEDLAGRGRTGTRVMREILTDRSPEYVAPASELERRFVEIVRRAGLPEPERQVDLGTRTGWVGRVDFLFRGVNLVVEVDGRPYHSALLDLEADQLRDYRLSASGRRVLRLRARLLRQQPELVVRLLREAFASRAA